MLRYFNAVIALVVVLVFGVALLLTPEAKRSIGAALGASVVALIWTILGWRDSRRYPEDAADHR